MKRIIRDKLGPIPDDHFENEPTFPPRNVSPLSEKMKKWIEKLKAERDKYQPDDEVGAGISRHERQGRWCSTASGVGLPFWSATYEA
jgi:hypothetical protein